MLENVIASVVGALNGAGIAAGCAYPKATVNRGTAFVAVGMESASDRSAGLARYLGIENDPETGDHEVYGLQCDFELRLDVYAPFAEENAAMACIRIFDNAAAAISAFAGLTVRQLTCTAPTPDKDTGMFRLRGGVKCSALLVARSSGVDETEFTDFVLRGELQG